MDLKKTPFHEIHTSLGAKFIEFHGWYLPVQFTSIIKEHKNTRKRVSLFDISHMGELLVIGKNAFDLLQYVCTNDLTLLKPGFAQYSPMCYENGTVVDDIFYYCYSLEKYRLIVNASNRDKDVKWLNKHGKRFPDVRIQDISDSRARLALQGPNAEDVLQKLVDVDLNKIQRFQFFEVKNEILSAFIGRTGYTAEDGFELSFPAEDSSKVWNALMSAGEEFGIIPAGLGARDTLRLEACYSLYGNEFSESLTPIEAGVEFVVKPTKKADYIGKKVLLAQLTGWVDKKIVALDGLEKGIIRPGMEIYDQNKTKVIGAITSGTYSPTFKKPIALAFIDSHFKIIGNIVYINVRGKFLPAKIVNRPFYPYHPRSIKS
ncbi:MAG: glycine cleavage system aminomethyltransferase GcvT [Promethearchaeota archaeon]